MPDEDESRERLNGLVTAIGAVGDALDEFDAEDEDERRVLARLRRVLSWAQTLSETSEPDLVSQGMIDRATTALDAVTTHVRAIPEDAAHLTRAAAYGDQFLDGVAGWPLPEADKKVSLAKREIDDLRKIATRATTDAEKEIERLDERIEEQKEENARVVTELRDTAASEVNAVTVSVEELRTTITEQAGRLETALTDFNTKLETQSATQKTAAEEVVTEIEEMRDEAKELLGVIGRTGMTAGYEQYEKQELGDADRWRQITMALGLSAVVVLAVAIWIALAVDDVGTNATVAKATLTATVLGLATYAAKQAKRHRDNATDARRRALALASIGPYLQPLEKARQDSVLEDFAFLFFALPETDSSEDSIAPASALGAFADRLQRRKKAAGG